MKSVLILSLNFIVAMSFHIFNREENYEKLLYKYGDKNVFHKRDSEFYFLGKVRHTKLGNDYHGLDRKWAEYEDELRSLLSMHEYHYNYKRGEFWRTWRAVKQENATKVIHYKCSGERDPFCKHCNDKGFWVMEATPPECLYEINYVLKDDKMCLATLFDPLAHTDACPITSPKNKLLDQCENPILTSWKFRRNHGSKLIYDRRRKYDKANVSKPTRYISGGKDLFDIKTHYLINKNEVIFRIINATDAIVFSKIMKPNKIAYICLENCGSYNANTRLITENTSATPDQTHEKTRPRWNPKYINPVDENEFL